MLNPQGQELWLSFCVIENLSRPRNMFLYCSTVTFFWCHTSPQTAHLSSRFRPRGRLSQLLQPPNRAPRHRHWQPWKCRHRPKISGIYNSCSESLQDFRKMSLHESSSKLETLWNVKLWNGHLNQTTRVPLSRAATCKHFTTAESSQIYLTSQATSICMVGSSVLLILELLHFWDLLCMDCCM